MDPVLAELYGTVTPQEDIEKTAQLDLLQKIAEAHDIDLDQLSDDQILEAVEALDGVEKVASDGGMDKEAEELFRNSDYGGRIFAHAMIDELRSIQKHASEEYDNPLLGAVMLEKDAIAMRMPMVRGKTLGTAAREGIASLKQRAAKAGGDVAERVGRGIVARKDAKFFKQMAQEGYGFGPKSAKRYGKRMAATSVTPEEARAMGKKVLKGVGAGVGGAAALTAAGVGGKAAYDRMSKKSFDEAVYERAAEHLAAAGLIDDSGEVLPPEYSEKTAQDVDAAALGLLEQMGYPVEWY